ncbi:MAG: DUF3343 domain-containing protein [Oscillospiraceae bacterium]|nr:DUF3343 domain-containing protein [Oscillospiraceae bacterium]
MEAIATFYSHFGAVRFRKLCAEAGWPAAMAPVPRSLSSSCGTCVRFTGEAMSPILPVPEEVEQIVQDTGGGYVPLYRAENS